jgi:predicted ATPase
MVSKVYPSLSVENFGPIKSGTVELKPLTIFIGPNNSGKSYMATLAYALLRSFNTQFGRPSVINGKIYARVLPLRLDWDFQVGIPEFERWIVALEQDHGSTGAQFGAYPKEIQELLIRDIEHEIELHRQSVIQSLTEYFQVSDIGDVVRQQGQVGRFFLRTAGQGADLLNAHLDNEGGFVSIHLEREWLATETFPLRFWLRTISGLTAEDQAQYIRERLNEAIRLSILAKYGMRSDRTHYLPAARSSILQSYQTFVALAVRLIRTPLGSESLPTFHGIVGDFFEELSRKDGQRKKDTPFAAALDLLETNVLQGKVLVRQGYGAQPHFLYAGRQVELPLERASSMVAELAPLALWMSDLAPSDFLFIDEPEAHLHPENQRQVARALVRLASAGGRVVCPTHSSLILHQISNHLIASKLPAEKRAEFGYTDDDLLDANDVGVYLFSLEEGGTVISPVAIDPEFGIDEEEFVRVFQAIGNETYDLSVAAQGELETVVHP